jgi:pimeloyl-ACP methyl ester carboxylesterase
MNVSPEVEDHTIRLDGGQVHYTERPGGGDALAFVGVNGLLGGGDSFWSVIEGVPSEVRVVLPDLPGCGDSDPLPEEHTITAYTAWLERFRAALGLKRMVLSSVATGAPITIRYALAHPDRVAGLIFHLPMLGRIAVPWQARPLIAYALRVPPLRALTGTLLRTPGVLERIIETEPPHAVPELAARDIAHKRQGDLRAAGDLLHDLMLMDSRRELARLRVPMLFLAAEHDAYSPLSLLENLTRRRPERRLYVEVGAPHSWNDTFIDHMNAEIAAFIAPLLDQAQQQAGDSTQGSGIGDQGSGIESPPPEASL